MDTALAETLTRWRRHLHANPGLTLREGPTAAFVVEKLKELGVTDIVENVGGHGVVATLSRPGSNHSVGLRGDMDALPIEEAAQDLPWRSTVPNVMHACGHDGHTTALLGAAALLLIEHHWAVPLRDAIARAGGFRIDDGFISPLDLVEIGLLGAEEVAEHALAQN